MSYLLCFWDKSKIQVNEIIGEKLKEAVKTEKFKHFTLGDSLYSLAGIEKIIPKDEAYNTFPTETEYLSQMTDKVPSNETLKALESPKLKSI